MNKCQVMVLLALVSATGFSQGEMTLSLSDALKTAVERNLDIQLERLTLNTRNIDIDLTWATYEPQVTSSLYTDENKTAATDGTQGDAGSTITSTNLRWNTSLSKQEWWGMGWSVSFNNSTNESDSRFSLGEQYGSNLSLGFEQDLLKGFEWDEEVLRYEEYVAKSDYAISRNDMETRLVTVLESVENAYWDLVLTREELEVNQTSLELAEDFYKQNKIKVEVGTLPPIDLINAESRIANSRRDVVNAENSVRAAEDMLKKILNLPVDQWDDRITPSDHIRIEDINANFRKDLDVALANRPEMRSNNENLRKAQLDLKVKKNELKPDLKLSGTYAYSGSSTSSTIYADPLLDPVSGLPYTDIHPVTGEPYVDPDGTPLQIPVGQTGPTYRESLSNLIQRDQPYWNVDLSLTWLPFNKAGKLNRAKSMVALRRQELSMEQTKVTIMEDVRSAVRNLGANKKSIEASEQSVKLSRESLKAEEQKFQNGLSTNYFVSEKQKELVEAETALIRTKINYVKAVVSYHKARGQLLEKRNIKLD